jgi:hypothetical protein
MTMGLSTVPVFRGEVSFLRAVRVWGKGTLGKGDVGGVGREGEEKRRDSNTFAT